MRSAIMMVGKLVLADGMLGITEVSVTYRPREAVCIVAGD
jgi:hypothetical protein